MKNNPAKKTAKGYYYDTKTHKRISKKEYSRRSKISAGLKKYWVKKKEKEKKEYRRRKKISASLKRYWAEKKEREDMEEILKQIEEHFEITEEEKQVWYHD